MDIFYISESVFHGLKLVTVHLELSYLVLIVVELTKSEFIASTHLKIDGSRFLVCVRT